MPLVQVYGTAVRREPTIADPVIRGVGADRIPFTAAVGFERRDAAAYPALVPETTTVTVFTAADDGSVNEAAVARATAAPLMYH